jgi:hypothetical protein
MRQILCLALFSAALLSSCGALLGVGAGVVISQEALDNNTYVAQIDRDADLVWATTKASLSHQSEELIEVDEDIRQVEAVIDGATTKVSVEVYDLRRSVVRVSARKFGVANGEIAEMVLDKLLADLEAQAQG